MANVDKFFDHWRLQVDIFVNFFLLSIFQTIIFAFFRVNRMLFQERTVAVAQKVLVVVRDFSKKPPTKTFNFKEYIERKLGEKNNKVE